MPVAASLHITVAERGELSYLEDAYVTPPYKLANITPGKSAPILELVVMSASPGILDNDVYEVEINVLDNAALFLQTQSYQRIFHMKESATQAMKVSVGANASLVYVPHPIVPHKAASFSSRNTIFLAENSKLIWGEIITCGRNIGDEQFVFSSYHNITEIFLAGRLIIKENLLMEPSLLNLQEIGLLEGYTHQATLICVADFDDLQQLMDKLHERLELEKNILFGITKAFKKGFVVRALGYKAEQLFDCWKSISDLVQSYNQQLKAQL